MLEGGLRVLTAASAPPCCFATSRGLPAEEVARQLNCSKATVRSHIGQRQGQVPPLPGQEEAVTHPNESRLALYAGTMYPCSRASGSRFMCALRPLQPAGGRTAGNSRLDAPPGERDARRCSLGCARLRDESQVFGWAGGWPLSGSSRTAGGAAWLALALQPWRCPVLLLVIMGWMVQSLPAAAPAASAEFVVDASSSGIGVQRDGRGSRSCSRASENVVYSVSGEAAGPAM